MRLSSNVITVQTLAKAFETARYIDKQDIWLSDIAQFNPRRARFGINFHAHSLTGKRKKNSGQYGSNSDSGYDRAASWEAYGYVIAHLFKIDPQADIAQYHGEQEFIDQCERLASLSQETGSRTKRDASFLQVFKPEPLITETASDRRMLYERHPLDDEIDASRAMDAVMLPDDEPS
jgi:hypothetical protein